METCYQRTEAMLENVRIVGVVVRNELYKMKVYKNEIYNEKKKKNSQKKSGYNWLLA